MKYRKLVPYVLLCLLIGCSPKVVKYSDHVNPLFGTAPITDPAEIGYTPPENWRVWAGLVFPGASLPNAMVQLSPVTAFGTGAGYQYEDTRILGFTHTCKGHWNLGNISVLPVNGLPDKNNTGSTFSHTNETASPGYYAVLLEDDSINVELSSTLRCGFHQYKFNSPDSAMVIFDLRKAHNRVDESVIHINSGNQIKGFQRTEETTVFFFAEFDQNFTESYKLDNPQSGSTNQDGNANQDGTANSVSTNPGADNTNLNAGRTGSNAGSTGYNAESSSSNAGNSNLNARSNSLYKDWKPVSGKEVVSPALALKFDLKEDQQLNMRVGISFVSMEQAEKNLRSEIPGWDFNTIKNNAEEIWESVLSQVQAEGGTDKERMMFYTSLYRAHLWPSLRSDVDGQFTDVNGKICKADYNYYSLPSLWDEFRNKLTLISILNPDLTGDIIQSMIEMGNKSGYMPIFFHGDHAAPYITGSYLRGIRNFDVKNAYALMLKNANDPTGPREHIGEYIAKGYISDPDIANPHVESKGKAGVAKTLEYAYDDYSISRLAVLLGDSANAQLFRARSMNYKNVFDPTVNFMRGRLDNGDWISPFDTEYPYYEYMFREANAWQQTFFVPHDVPGLIELFGGWERFESKLDSMYILPWNPQHIARNVDCFIGQYCHGNQPDHHVPFLYHFLGKPEKSQQIIDKIHTMYGIGMDGLALPGMDDTGEMSSWYVFTAMGLYPFSPSDTTYLVTAPIFNTTKINLPNGNSLEINKHTGSKNSVKSIAFNGKQINNYSIDHSGFIKGGVVDIYLE